MECNWFLCVGLRFGAGTIAVLGILHPLAYWRAARRFRSELFLAMYVLVALWSVLSALLLLGVLTDTAWLLALWVGYSILFVVLMVVLLIFVTVGFCVLDMKNSAIIPILGIIYYILTLYLICVVNTHRRDLLGMRALRQDHVKSPAEWLARQRQPKDSSGVRRGGCRMPGHPAAGAYAAQAAGAAGAGGGVAPGAPGAVYSSMRLLLYCREGYQPRHRRYVDCYSGGWNLPLPQCVPVAEGEESDQEEDDAGSQACVARSPPAHGFYLQLPERTRRGYLALEVACTPMHYLVGRPRVTCRDGIWDRPLPQCVFVDSSVCAVPRKPHMRHTCLGGELYAGTYTCDAGLVPHGGVVEPACHPGYYVWGSFTYMHCVDGRWMPTATRSLSCVSKADIYGHYYAMMASSTKDVEENSTDPVVTNTEAYREEEAVGASLSASTDPPPPPSEPGDEASTQPGREASAQPGREASAQPGREASAQPGHEESVPPEGNLTKTIIRMSRSEASARVAAGAAASTSICRTRSERDKPFDTRPNTNFTDSPTSGVEPFINNFTQINIWKPHGENDNSVRESIWKTRSESSESPSTNLTDIWNSRDRVPRPPSRSSTPRTNIWKSRNDTGGWQSNNTNIWKSDGNKWSNTNSTNKTNTRISRSEADAAFSRKSSRVNIWKGRTEASEPVDTESTRVNIWKSPLPRRKAAAAAGSDASISSKPNTTNI